MTQANPNMSGASLRRREREPDPDTGFEPDGDIDTGSDDDGADDGAPDWSEDDAAPETAGELVARFEDVKVGVRKLSAERCVIGVDIDLALDAGEPGVEDGESEGPEYSLDADEVTGMLSTPPAQRKLTPLAAPAAPGVQPRPRRRWKFDRRKFFRGYAAAFSRLDQRQMAGLHALLTAAEADPQITDLRWLAYMLATVQHECAGTWRPIEEYGKGAGRPYGRPVVVTDPQGKRYRNVYYGRGYVQLTWKANYQRMGKLLKNRLLYNPALALRPAIAYRIMSAGMRRGLFTGKKLADYIHGKKADYVNARRIINGLDQAQKLARNAVKLANILRRSAVRPTSNPPN